MERTMSLRVRRVLRGGELSCATCCRRLASGTCVAALVIAFSGLSVAAATDLRLIQAGKNRDVESVRELLKQRPVRIDVYAAQGDGATARHWAAHHDVPAPVALRVRFRAPAHDAH